MEGKKNLKNLSRCNCHLCMFLENIIFCYIQRSQNFPFFCCFLYVYRIPRQCCGIERITRICETTVLCMPYALRMATISVSLCVPFEINYHSIPSKLPLIPAPVGLQRANFQKSAKVFRSIDISSLQQRVSATAGLSIYRKPISPVSFIEEEKRLGINPINTEIIPTPKPDFSDNAKRCMYIRAYIRHYT